MANPTVSNSRYHSLFSEHRQLMREIAELRRWWQELDEIGIPKYSEMGSRLKTLRDHLQTHFAEEEVGGYLAEALAVAPELTSEADRLRAQHGQFLATLDSFIEKLQAPKPTCCWESARQELEDFLSLLRAHEAAENSIMQSAVGDDSGTVD